MTSRATVYHPQEVKKTLSELPDTRKAPLATSGQPCRRRECTLYSRGSQALVTPTRLRFLRRSAE